MVFSYNCYAKINLFLHINGKRPDGYHNLQSLFSPINLYDVLYLQKSPRFCLNIVGNYQQQLSATQHNIITKIWQYCLENFQLDSNLTITLQKNIPVGAGLGGGSSNGTAFLLAVNKLFSLQLNTSQLLEISLKFGSDLPFFLLGKPALVFGRGEEVVPLEKPLAKPLPKLPILLINPQINLSTALVFAKNSNFSQPLAVDYLQNLDFMGLLALGNDLEKSAISLLPEIAEILACLNKFQPLTAKMSGSGSSCFAVFANKTTCRVAYIWFRQNFPQYFVKML
ncbi:MAG: 4-(cytidine 5'-diphospho)-2-C-methyl-D-erythritol kinase [Proteobacteria bacterium]|nr:4-(cytidine 5'-diphospho)-2-C-methyl-D-erythritol kinase [Pseudomonadota bacterium]